MKKKLGLLLLIMVPLMSMAEFRFESGKKLNVVFSQNEAQVTQTAFELFQQDFKAVFGAEIKKSDKKGNALFGTLGVNSKAESLATASDIQQLKAHEEAFLIKVIDDKLIVLGRDERGTAYGILELSRLIGVSPWVWWADSPIDPKDKFVLEDGFRDLQYPSVARRGIFINDEDWGLTPWSYQTYEPSDIKGQIGPKTHTRIFELLLRLRANTFWPAMHNCSIAFYLTPGNREAADKYGIYVGSSHCEPMVRNTNAEWADHGEGDYDYVNNRDNVLRFWEERVQELSQSSNIFTLGMRGKHDGKMEGAKTIEQQKEALTKIFVDQREMIAKYVNPNVEEVSQVFIPYKEVLDVYNAGLEVPEDVSLMWTDDNYGYIRHFPDSIERKRKGGNGVYYHVSYWGRPHDYLWLATNHPAQIYGQMKLAYDKGARDMWIVNVGDIKPAEYLTEFFMDLAWSINGIEESKAGLDAHLRNWLSREFGEDKADELTAIMTEYYRLAYIRKPEFMGNTRTEERHNPESKIVKDLPWSEAYIKERLDSYQAIQDQVMELSKTIPEAKKEAWFQLVAYPVHGAAEMNKKHLYAQLARHGKADWKMSDEAYETIEDLTRKYNSLNNGKWSKMMDHQPRRLEVFAPVPHEQVETSLIEERETLVFFNGEAFNDYSGNEPLALGLGYERGAITLPKGTSVTYTFDLKEADSLIIELALAPNHPVKGKDLRYTISLNDEPAQIVDYHTEGRSEEWKQNVLTNQAIRQTQHAGSKGNQTLKITGLDEGVILDQIRVYTK